MQVIGVATSVQREGWGTQAVAVLVGHAGFLHPAATHVHVRAAIHLDTIASQTLFGRFGLRVLEPAHPGSNPYALWAGTVGLDD